MIPDNPWEDGENARRYAGFTRKHSLYRQSSQDLVRLAHPAPDASVVDLACGTGATTEAVLAVLGADGRVLAVDSAQAMLTEARSQVRDDRVRWLRARAEHLDRYGTGAVDVVVCNSAIWQTDVSATVAAVRRVLRAGGRFVFNVGAQLLADHADPGRPGDPLIELMETIAARDHGWAAPPVASGRHEQGELSESGLRRELVNNGFRVRQVCGLQYWHSLEDRRAWLSIPIFTLRRFAALPYRHRMAILDEAYCRLTANGSHREPLNVPWIAIIADVYT
ncbi:MAG TPA: class I SAM-dependent methyltransferase [Streptosporangiaceae bacterium]